MRTAIRGQGEADVPCGTCTACCTASQFVHIAPDETAALARIPKALLFPAPRAPKGHVLIGYDERGHCPMLVERGCSIYEDRPRTCRTYDCRVFAAAGVEREGGGGGDLINQRVRRWRFSYEGAAAEAEHAAVRAAAAFVRARTGELPAEHRPANATQLAVMAVETSDEFVDRPDPDLGAVVAALARRRR